MERTYEVAGGWQAEDEDLFIACFGRTESDARAALERARTQAQHLRKLAEAKRASGQLYGEAQ